MINSQDIYSVVNQIVVNYQPEKIILFGSYSQNTATENSDIDLFVIKNTDLPRYQRCSAVWKDLAKSKFRFPVDIIVYTPQEVETELTNKYSLAYEVYKTGKIVYDYRASERVAT